MLYKWRSTKGRGNPHYDTTCKLCKKEEEDLVHFMVKCETLESKRDYKILDKEIKNPELRLRTLLFKNEDIQAVGKLIRNLWDLRKKPVKTIKSPV